MGMSCDCGWGDDGVTLHNVSTPRARKEYTCTECRRPIRIGEIYTRVEQLFDGAWYSYTTCERCDDLAESYSALGYCYCFGELWRDHLEFLIENGVPEDSRAVQTARAVIAGTRPAATPSPFAGEGQGGGRVFPGGTEPEKFTDAAVNIANTFTEDLDEKSREFLAGRTRKVARLIDQSIAARRQAGFSDGIHAAAAEVLKHLESCQPEMRAPLACIADDIRALGKRGW